MVDKEIKKLIQQMSIKEKQALQAWLAAEVEREKADQAIAPKLGKNRELVEQQRIGNITYQLEMVKCGKAGCKCSRGELHGPYWYAYQQQGDKFKSKYIGKIMKFPEEKKI